MAAIKAAVNDEFGYDRIFNIGDGRDSDTPYSVNIKGQSVTKHLIKTKSDAQRIANFVKKKFGIDCNIAQHSA